MGSRSTDCTLHCPCNIWNLSFFRRTRESENPCDSCVSGCDLKDMMEKKRQECGVKKKYKEKLLRIVGSFKICTTFATANEKKWFLG